MEGPARPPLTSPTAKNPSCVVKRASEPQVGALHKLTVPSAFHRSGDGGSTPAAKDLNLHEVAFFIEKTCPGACPGCVAVIDFTDMFKLCSKMVSDFSKTESP